LIRLWQIVHDVANAFQSENAEYGDNNNNRSQSVDKLPVIESPALESSQPAVETRVLEVLHVPRLWLRKIAKRYRYQDERDEEKQHDVDACYHPKLFEDCTLRKSKHREADRRREVAEEGDDSHSSHHCHEGLLLI